MRRTFCGTTDNSADSGWCVWAWDCTYIELVVRVLCIWGCMVRYLTLLAARALMHRNSDILLSHQTIIKYLFIWTVYIYIYIYKEREIKCICWVSSHQLRKYPPSLQCIEMLLIWWSHDGRIRKLFLCSLWNVLTLCARSVDSLNMSPPGGEAQGCSP